MPPDVKPGFMAYNFEMKGFKLSDFGDNIQDSLFYKDSGIFNIIPYMLEVDKHHTWIPFL